MLRTVLERAGFAQLYEDAQGSEEANIELRDEWESHFADVAGGHLLY